MKIEFKSGDAFITEIACFDIKETFDCGQCFRFNEIKCDADTRIYEGVALNKVLRISQSEHELVIHNTNESDVNLWVEFLDLGRDYQKIQRKYMKHPLLYECAKHAPGIHIIKQDAFESLISFIISQNNNIKRIKGIVERLCALFGEPIENGYHSFPSPQKLASLSKEDLAPLRCGWRDEYILDASAKVVSGAVDFSKIKQMNLADARKNLQIIKGVGPKVAECVLLYGMNRLECFPMDVWMKRAMDTLFPNSTPEDFSPFPGVAQQYIFHYSRLHPELFPGK